MLTIAIVNQKGGCGKTTTAINLGATLGESAHRTLLVDMDPQGHASLGLGHASADLPSLFDVFKGARALGDIVQRDVATGLDLIPANISLAGTERLLGQEGERSLQLKHHLAPLRDIYDVAILDCPPALGVLSINALSAADDVLVPVDASLFGLDGIERLRETIEFLRGHYEIRPRVTLLANMFDQRTRFAREILETLEGYPELRLARARIRNTVRLREAAYRGLPITRTAPRSAVVEDFRGLAAELLKGRALRPRTQQAVVDDGLRQVVLSFDGGANRSVQVAGDFNSWQPDADVDTHVSRGVLEKVFSLRPGDYQYRLIVDGVWQPDPDNPLQVPNGLGDKNSLLRVR